MINGTKDKADGGTKNSNVIEVIEGAASHGRPGHNSLASAGVEAANKTKIFIDEDLLAREQKIRGNVIHNTMLLSVINFFASIIVFGRHLISLEMFVSLSLNVASTAVLYQRLQVRPDAFDGSIMDFVLLSFAIVIPLSNTVQMAFQRREDALLFMASFRAYSVQAFMAHAHWDWVPKSGNTTESGRAQSTVDWAEHAGGVLRELVSMGHEMTRYLTLPSSTRARHRALSHFISESRDTQRVGIELHMSVIKRMANISDFGEVLKREGLATNEASRLRQSERCLVENCEKLRMIKMYRTPQALRSFGRLFSMLLPAFYSPFFAEMGYRLNSLTFGIVFAVITSIALTGLFEIVTQFEDPFAANEASALDGIHVHDELVGNLVPQLLMLMNKYYPNASVIVHAELRPEDGPLRTGVRVVDATDHDTGSA